MKILHVLPLYHPILGGVQSHVSSIASGLKRRGHDVEVLTVAHVRQVPHEEIVDGVLVHRVSGVGPSDYRIPIGMASFLRSRSAKFDVVHAHNFGGLPLLIAATVCPNHLVITPHYHGRGHDRMADALHRVYDPLARRILRQVPYVICVSRGEANQVATNLGIPREKLLVIPNIIDLPSEMRSQGSNPSDESHVKTILTVGRLERYKRVDRVVAAIPFLPPEYQLVIVGPGPERENLIRQAKYLNVADRVHVPGYVSDEAIDLLYQSAAVVISLSEGEAFGRVVIEGLAHQCQIVCSSIPAFNDFMEDFPGSVILVQPNQSSKEIALVLEKAAHCLSLPIDLSRFMEEPILERLEEVYQAVSHHQPGHSYTTTMPSPMHRFQ